MTDKKRTTLSDLYREAYKDNKFLKELDFESMLFLATVMSTAALHGSNVNEKIVDDAMKDYKKRLRKFKKVMAK